MSEIIFEVTEDGADGGCTASALGYGIHTQGDSLEDLRRNVSEAADCHFDDSMPRPETIRLKSGRRHHELNIEQLLREPGL